MRILKLKSRGFILFICLLLLTSLHARTALPAPVIPVDAPPMSDETAVNQSPKGRMGEKLLLRMVERKMEKYARKQGFFDDEDARKKKKKKKKNAGEGGAWNGISMGLGIASMPLIGIAFLSAGPVAAVLLLLGIISAVVGLVFGTVGVRRKYEHRGMGIAGIITSCISLGALVVLAIAGLIALMILLING